MLGFVPHPYGPRDASLGILAESLGDCRILSTDCMDFNAYRWKERQPFGLMVVTDNGSEFSWVPGLLVESWLVAGVGL